MRENTGLKSAGVSWGSVSGDGEWLRPEGAGQLGFVIGDQWTLANGSREFNVKSCCCPHQTGSNSPATGSCLPRISNHRSIAWSGRLHIPSSLTLILYRVRLVTPQSQVARPLTTRIPMVADAVMVEGGAIGISSCTEAHQYPSWLTVLLVHDKIWYRISLDSTSDGLQLASDASGLALFAPRQTIVAGTHFASDSHAARAQTAAVPVLVVLPDPSSIRAKPETPHSPATRPPRTVPHAPPHPPPMACLEVLHFLPDLTLARSHDHIPCLSLELLQLSAPDNTSSLCPGSRSSHLQLSARSTCTGVGLAASSS